MSRPAALHHDSRLLIRHRSLQRFRRSLLFCGCMLFINAPWLMMSAAAQTADWTDSKLTVRDGLITWLDASTIVAARSATGAAELASGDPLDVWNDGSKYARPFRCASPDHRPLLVQIGKAWTVRFDGQNDALRNTDGSLTSTNASIFLVAAPHENPGGFRGFLAANAADRRDYESGLTIDLGPVPGIRFEQLNVEGSGFGGAVDLMESSHNFGTLHILETEIDAGRKQVSLTVDGESSGSRPCSGASISFEQLTVGARFYTNGAGEQQVQGNVKADIAELLVYDRTLTTDEKTAVRLYLTNKYAQLVEDLPQELRLSEPDGTPLVMAENPPQVQLLFPGFAVHELPLELTNVNNVRYRTDGKLVTLGYNGDIHLLTDTDGDGIEDTAQLFWKNEGSIRGPIGMLLTPPGYSRGQGVFVPSKGKVSLIVDTNGDDRADEEIIVASGWKEIFTTVDALGIAMDKDQNIYFGLGVANFANAYQTGDDGKARYDIHADNGTIQKVSADFSQRETVCTGIRFPVALAFNRHGDLFCTEQEGATWLPNGNPLDELLHIRPQRHYGFPPRHPQHNPDVIDEPSTFDYGPQHQSTCGMVFNESVNGGPVFGPNWWADDALVCGESRGKLWRTTLIRTDAGYVAASQLFACLQMLTVDTCVAPNGDLIVACHSGPPDWGTGPTGIGKLFRIQMVNEAAPRPVATWAEQPQEIRIAFDRPLDPLALRNLSAQVLVEYGEHVRAGDRFENLVPPYAVVQAQLTRPRFQLLVSGVSVTSDLRTLIISTAPMQTNLHYAVTLPVADAEQATSQHPQIDVDFALHGLQVTWKPTGESTAGPWSGWLPHPDLEVCRHLLAHSHGHQALWDALQTDGLLTLKTKLNLHNILRPAVQPGAAIDYEWPAETASFVISSSHEIVMQATRSSSGAQQPTELAVVCDQSNLERKVASLTTSADEPDLIDVTLEVRTGGGKLPLLTAAVFTNEDSSLRPLPLHRFALPWVRPMSSSSDAEATIPMIAELEGGSWARGRRVFRSNEAGCFKCHAVSGGGARIGPDLMNLVHRDYASVMRDVVNPGFAINPDYIGHTVVLHDGRLLTGVLQTEDGQLLLGNEKGEVIRLTPEEIESMTPAKASVMPAGLLEKLSAQQVKDLMTYMLTKPPQMPLDSPLTAPPLRTPSEVAAVLAGSPDPAEPARPLNIILAAGPKDHGPGEHDYPVWQQVWEELLTAASDVHVSTAWEFPDDPQLAAADVVIFFQKGSWDADRSAKIDAFLARGGGLVYIHWAVNGNDQVQDFARRIGMASWGGRIKFRHGPLTLDIHNTDHPIVRNFDQVQFYDESYWKLTGNPDDITLLATSTEDGMPTPQMWVRQHGKGRVFVSIPGHYSWTFDDPLFRVLLLRGIAWTAGEPVDRFNELVPLGARITR